MSRGRAYSKESKCYNVGCANPPHRWDLCSECYSNSTRKLTYTKVGRPREFTNTICLTNDCNTAAWCKGYCKPCYSTVKSREYRKKYPHLPKVYNLKQLGVTVEQYEILFDRQQGLCGICRKEPPMDRALAVDHCHVSLFVRGLLCMTCNTALGKFHDDPAILLRAVDWVTKPPTEFKASPRAYRRRKKDQK